MQTGQARTEVRHQGATLASICQGSSDQEFRCWAESCFKLRRVRLLGDMVGLSLLVSLGSFVYTLTRSTGFTLSRARSVRFSRSGNRRRSPIRVRSRGTEITAMEAKDRFVRSLRSRSRSSDTREDNHQRWTRSRPRTISFVARTVVGKPWRSRPARPTKSGTRPGSSRINGLRRLGFRYTPPPRLARVRATLGSRRSDRQVTGRPRTRQGTRTISDTHACGALLGSAPGHAPTAVALAWIRSRPPKVS